LSTLYYKVLHPVMGNVVFLQLGRGKGERTLSLLYNTVLNIYSVILILVIYHHSYKDDTGELKQRKIFHAMLRVAVVLLFVDIISRFDGPGPWLYRALNQIGNFLSFLFNLALPSLWLAYVHSIVFPQKPLDRRIVAFLLVIYAVHLFLMLSTPFTGWLYCIDSDNVYHRGPLFWVSVLLIAIILLASIVFLLLHRQKIGQGNLRTLMLFVLPPVSGIALQWMFYGLSLVFPSLAISFLIVLLNLQVQDMYTDYLTGINNRKKFDLYLQQKIEASRDGKTFSAIMMDLNDFKSINDVYGHHVGDAALQAAAKLFRSCIRETDFIARIGGDEFCIITDITSKPQLRKLVERINKSLAEFNESNSRPYKLSVSMGYAVYDPESGVTLEEFKRHIDSLMYTRKHSAKAE